MHSKKFAYGEAHTEMKDKEKNRTELKEDVSLQCDESTQSIPGSSIADCIRKQQPQVRSRRNESAKVSALTKHKVMIVVLCILFVAGTAVGINESLRVSNAAVEAQRGFQLLGDGHIEDGLAHLETAVRFDGRVVSRMRSVSFGEPPERTLEATKNALLLNPGDADAFANRAEALSKLGRLQEAEASYRKATSLGLGEFAPIGNGVSDGNTVAGFARLLIKLGKKAEAIDLLKRNCAVSYWDEDFENLCKEFKIPNRSSLMQTEGINLQLALSNARSAALEEDRYSEALERVEKELTKYPAFPQVILTRASVNKAKNPDASIKDVDRVLAVYPGQAEAYYVRSEAHLAKHDYKSALKDIDLALKQLPHSPELWLQRATINFENGNWKESLNDLNKGEYVVRPVRSIVNKRCEVLLSVGDYKNAVSALETQLRCQRANDLSLSYLHGRDSLSESTEVLTMRTQQVRVLVLAKKYAEAERKIDSLLARDERELFDLADLYLAKSQICRQRGDYSGALAAVSKAIPLESDNGAQSDRSLTQRAIIYRLMGEKKKAKDDFQAALNMVQGRLKEEPFLVSDLFDRVLLLECVGSSSKDVRGALAQALKFSETDLNEVSQFVVRVKQLDNAEFTQRVLKQILVEFPRWKPFVQKWSGI